MSAPTCPKECDGGKAENVIGVEVSDVYDGVLFWHCAVCGARWHRWPDGSRLRVLAEPYVLDFGSSPVAASPSPAAVPETP